jgi:hypothetical protein
MRETVLPVLLAAACRPAGPRPEASTAVREEQPSAAERVAKLLST